MSRRKAYEFEAPKKTPKAAWRSLAGGNCRLDARRSYSGAELELSIIPNNIFRVEFSEINLDRLQDAIDAKKLDTGSVVNAEALVKAGVLRRAKAGLRLLGRGELKAKLNIEVHGASKSAIAAVEKAGGSVKILAPATEDEGKAA